MEKCYTQHGGVKNVTQTITTIKKFCQTLKSNNVKDSQELFLKLPLVVQCMFLSYCWDILANKEKHSIDSYKTAFYLFKLFRDSDMKAHPIYSDYAKKKILEDVYKAAFDWDKNNSATQNELTIEDYSDKAIVVRGDTKSVKLELLELGGKYNPNLQGGAGWIFSKKAIGKVSEFINSKTLPESSSSRSTPTKTSSSSRSTATKTSSSSKSTSTKTTSSSKSTPTKRAAKPSKYSKKYQRYDSPKSTLDPLYIYYTSLLNQNPESRLAITWLTEHGVYDGDERDKLIKIYEKLVAKGKLIK